MKILLVFVLSVLSYQALSKFQYMVFISYSLTLKDRSYLIHDTDIEDVDTIITSYSPLLVGQYENFINQTGWGFLFIETNGNSSDYDQVSS